ncbi:MAG: hypothetical protein L3J58_10540 [Emcibacter sp.]|nr:hypothetical protein [Emcibacter sp.]
MGDNAPNRLLQSAKEHLRTAVIAVVFGLTAYGLIHILIWAVRAIENL